MNIAVLSDIHGNYIAMEECIQYALKQGISTFIFLGDYLGELAYPERTMRRLYELQRDYYCIFIRGNKEDYWLNYRRNGETGWYYGDSATGSLLYQYERLTEADMSFYESLPISKKVAFEGMPELTICHGSPVKTNQKLLPEDESTKRIIEACDTDIIVCGHTHFQRTIEHMGKQVWNPGSVGVAKERSGKTQFMLLNGNDRCWLPEYISLEYDREKVIHDLYEVGLDKYAPYWCKITEHLLRKGESLHSEVLFRAMELCKEEQGVCNWPGIPEKYWEKAYREIVENKSEI